MLTQLRSTTWLPAMVATTARQDRATPAPDIEERLSRIAELGFDVFRSELTVGVIDISFPVLDSSGQAIAALTVPFLPQVGITPDQAAIMELQAAAARRISEGIGGGQQP